ncbi:MAG: NarK/NasA family nitrate transporter, partial [Candidatus Thioglobus sp.]
FNTFKIWQVNKVFIKNPSKSQSYKFKQVAVLKASYFVTFGAELALVSILALFYAEWFGVSKFYAALLSGIYPFLNLFSRPLGGFISDKIGRKLTIIIVFSGISVVFLALGLLDKSWPIWLVVVLSIAGGIFSQAGSGAVFAIAPLIQKRLTGQIAGMVGAFGNIGAVVFLTINSFVEYDKFFLFIGISGFFVLVLIILLLENPQKQTVNP